MSLIALQAEILTKGNKNVYDLATTKQTILLVDDEESVRDFVQMLLEGEGYQVLVAANGVEALEIYDRFSSEIGLVVSDIKMPKMDGVALYKALSARNPEVKFLAISGFMIPEAFNQLTKWGLLDVIRKPFSIEVLIQKVEAILA